MPLEAGLVGIQALQEAWESLEGSYPVVGAGGLGHQATGASREEVEEGGYPDQLLQGMGEGRGDLDHREL